ncbi:MAG: efflux RND transporter periplasmic adaptor subunit [Thermodesulfobacteriota bacterium]
MRYTAHEVLMQRGPRGVVIPLMVFLALGLSAAKAPAWAQQGRGSQEGGLQAIQNDEQSQAEELPPTVEISAEKRQLLGVRTAEVSMIRMVRNIRTVGRTEYDERRLATVNTKFEGWIEKLYVDYTGRFVRKGELMAEIYSPELLATQQEFLSLLNWTKPRGDDAPWGETLARDAQVILQAAKERLKLWDMTEEQIQELERTQKPIRTIKILSPATGYVMQKMAVLGMRVMPGEKLFDLADLSTLWILAEVYEYELPFLRVGMPAKVTLSYLPGAEFSSRIDYIYPTVSSETRTARVRLLLPNPKGMLKPQMFANVEIRVDLGPRLTVPSEAVIDTGTRQIVYVDRGEGLFEPREVKLGMRTQEVAEVIRGLRAGEKVAASGAFLVDSEAQLKGVEPLGGHQH